jgi:phosphoglycerate dehydrogenase-like enzyme
MASFQLLVIADPAAFFLKALSELPQDVNVVVRDDVDKLIQSAPDVDAILFAHVKAELLAKVLPVAKRVRWIHCLWTGVEGVLTPEVLAHPAVLTNGRGVFRWPLADWVMGVMLLFAFDLRRVIRQQEQGIWEPFIGSTLSGKTLGIVGYGSIGSATAERARLFGMKIAALRRRPDLFGNDSIVDQSFGPGQLKELMAVSDYVLVATPLTPETRAMIAEAEFAVMKPTAVIINVGRGPAIDEASLIRALESGKIRGAGLDVFDTEPLPAGHRFWRMKNVLLSPHTADRVEGFLEPAFECFLENLKRFREGSALLNVVDKQAGY